MPKVKRNIEPFSQNAFRLVQDFTAIENNAADDYFHQYLFFNGLIDNQDGTAKTYIYVERNGEHEKILGFYSIRCSSLIVNNGDNGGRIGEPALEILELAVHKDYQGQGIGSDMIKTIFSTAYKLKNEFLGIRHIVVCAKSTAKSYYERFGFQALPNYRKIPRSFDNQDCIGMSVRLEFN